MKVDKKWDYRQFIPDGEYCGTCPFRKLHIRCRFYPMYNLVWADTEEPFTVVFKHPDCPGKEEG